jgi:hypothetical protein
LFLLSRGIKRNPGKLVWIAGLVLVMRLWIFCGCWCPRFRIASGSGGRDSLLGFGGLWLAFFTWQLANDR